MKIFCAYCGVLIAETVDFPRLSSDHGMCEDCRKLRDAERDDFYRRMETEEKAVREKLNRLLEEPSPPKQF